MKCQNCGKNEINFHYSSNVNGCVTETYLCSECAAKSGYDFERMFNTDSIFNNFFPADIRRAARLLPIPVFGFMSPFVAWQQPGLPAQGCGCDASCETAEKETAPAQVDEEMQKRREINAIREQMRLAAEKEDFEKAAELRDRIRQLEAD